MRIRIWSLVKSHTSPSPSSPPLKGGEVLQPSPLEGEGAGEGVRGRAFLPHIILHKKGFTLIEVLVVVFILGILAALVAPKMLGRTDDAKIAETKLQMKNLETALKLYKLDNGLYPTTDQGLDALITKPASEPIPKKYKDDGYLEKNKIPKDAWGNPYLYLSPGSHGDFDMISYGSDGKPGGEGKDADIKNWELE